MSGEANHICVCICTYKRLQLLRPLLESLRDQETDGLFTYSIVVADNDPARSAEAVTKQFADSCTLSVRYCMQPSQNVPLTRNKALEIASGDFIAFIDDDQFAMKSWLLTLFKTCKEHDVAGVLGPVKPHFDEGVPNWVVKGKFYERPTYPTGLAITWTMGRTGNVLLRRSVFPLDEPAFRPEFRGGGADQDFFRRMIEKGDVFIWCEEAVAYEVVPPVRWRRSFMLRKALLRGGVTPLHPDFGLREIAKSAVAVSAYTVALPFALFLGQHRFMTLLVKLCDHLGKLLACVGIKPVKAAYVTE